MVHQHHQGTTENEKNANRISDSIVLMANTELGSGLPGSVVVVGICLGLLGVLADNDSRLFHKLTVTLKYVIGQITGIKDGLKFYDAPEDRPR